MQWCPHMPPYAERNSREMLLVNHVLCQTHCHPILLCQLRPQYHSPLKAPELILPPLLLLLLLLLPMLLLLLMLPMLLPMLLLLATPPPPHTHTHTHPHTHTHTHPGGVSGGGGPLVRHCINCFKGVEGASIPEDAVLQGSLDLFCSLECERAWSIKSSSGERDRGAGGEGGGPVMKTHLRVCWEGVM